MVESKTPLFGRVSALTRDVSFPVNHGAWRNVALAGALMGLVVCPVPAALAQDPTAKPPSSLAPSMPNLSAEPRKAESAPNWDVMLQNMMSSPAQRKLMGELRELVRKGDIAAARQLLSSAVDVGTVAIVMNDFVDDPALGPALEKLPIETPDQVASSPAPSAKSEDAAAAERRVGELSQALDQERGRAAAAAQAVADLQAQLAAAQAGTGKVADLERDLAAANERAASAAREAESLRSQSASAKDNAARAAELEAAAAREKQRADAALSTVKSLQGRLASAEIGSAEATALRDALQQEKDRAAAAARELAALKTQLASAQPAETRAAALQAALDKEKERSAAASEDLRQARERLAALQATEPKMAETVREVEALKSKLAGLKALETRTAQLEAELGREKQRAEAAARDLGAVSAQLASARASAAKDADAKSAAERKDKIAADPGGMDELKTMLKAAMADYVAATAGKVAPSQQKAQHQAMARQIEAAQGQLALWGNRQDFIPAALLFQSPLAPDLAPDRTGSIKIEEPERKPISGPAPAVAPKPKAGSVSKPEPKPEAAKPSPNAGRVASGRAEPPPVRSSVQRTPPPRPADRAQSVRGPRLPRSLQPVDEIWEFY